MEARASATDTTVVQLTTAPPADAKAAEPAAASGGLLLRRINYFPPTDNTWPWPVGPGLSRSVASSPFCR